MELRDVQPFTETHAQRTAARPASEPRPPESAAPANASALAGIALSDSDTVLNLAQEMEQARQDLLQYLLKSPQARELLTEQLPNVVEHPKYGDDENIVQDYHFVQPNVVPLQALDRPSQSAVITGISEAGQFQFMPTLLISVAKQIERQAPLNPAYLMQLMEYRRRLHDSRQRMIAANTGLAAFVSYKHKTTNLSFEDLMQEGIIGLIRAVDRFDPYRGICFSTYAIFWIKQAISRLIIKQEKVVRLPVAMAEKASSVFEAMRSCYLENDRWPSLAELQRQCGLPPDEIKIISAYYQATHSLDASLSEDDDDQTLMSRLEQQQFAQPLNELIDKHLSLYLGKAVASLPEKEAAILNMRFGLKNHTEMTLQAVADQLHVTRERVRQIQNEALKKLKQQFGYDLLPFLEPNDS